MRVQGFFAPLSTTMPDGVDTLKNLFRENTGDVDRPYRYVRRPGHLVYSDGATNGLDGPVRGAVEKDGRCFVIGGTKFAELFDGGVVSVLGTVDPDTRPACMISNGTAGNQVAGISGGKLYRYNTSTESYLGHVNDPDLPADILGLVHSDTYAIVWFRNSRGFMISSLLDLSAWDSGDIAERSQYVDNIVSIVADQKELQILGSETQEQWWNSGNSSFPFEPVPNALSLQGSAATHGACLVGDSPYWVGKSPTGMGPIFRTRGGYTPERISTHWVERRIQALALLSDAYAYSYEEMGHRFYVLTFPNADVSLAFDEAVDPLVAWSEWSYHNPYSSQRESVLGRCHVFAFGKNLVGSRRDGTIYEQTLDAYDDAGDAIHATRRFFGPWKEGALLTIPEARLHAQVGVGLTTGQGADPQVMLRKSSNGGRTWGPELWRGLGAIGEYGTQVVWRRMGQAREPAWELTYTDPTVLGLNEFTLPGAH